MEIHIKIFSHENLKFWWETIFLIDFWISVGKKLKSFHCNKSRRDGCPSFSKNFSFLKQFTKILPFFKKFEKSCIFVENFQFFLCSCSNRRFLVNGSSMFTYYWKFINSWIFLIESKNFARKIFWTNILSCNFST